MNRLCMVLALVLASTSYGQSFPAHIHRPNFSNRTGGHCMWAATTTWARGYGWTGNLVQNARYRGVGGPAYSWQVNQRLDQLGIPHSFQQSGSYQQRPFPFVGTFKWGTYRDGRQAYHGLLVLSNNGYNVRYIDPNHPGKIRTMPSRQFWPRWSGNAIYR